MDQIQNVRERLIQRYSKLSNVSVDKGKSKLNNRAMDDIMEIHHTSITISIVLVILSAMTVLLQFYTLYRSHNFPYALLPNILMVIIFSIGLRDHLEIKQILKMLREIGVG